MATWQTSITVTNLAEKRVSISATRTDGADVTSYSAETIFDSGSETLAQFQTRLGTLMWQQHLAATSQQSTIDTLIGASESVISAGLDAQEVA